MKKLNADRIVSVSAIIVSLGTLFIIVYQTNLTRKAQKASVMPYISVAMSFHGAQQRIIVENTGLGPAVIKFIGVDTGDSLFAGDPYAFAQASLGSGIEDIQYSTDIIMPGRLIPADKALFAFSHYTSEGNGDFIKQNFKFPYHRSGKHVIVIDYESVYGDQWRVKSDVNIPEQTR